jgi:hypothetical protein
MKNLVYEKNSGKIAGIWPEQITIENAYPNHAYMADVYASLPLTDEEAKVIYENMAKFKIINEEIVELAPEELNPPPTREQKVQAIKYEYQTILDNLIMTKQRMEMLGQPVDTIITAFQAKKVEMDTAIRGVRQDV